VAGLLKSLRLLSDPVRVRLLLLLEKEELSVAELQQILTRGQSQISTHLAQLRSAGLVADRREGKNSFYSLSAEARPLLAILHKAAPEIPESGDDIEALRLVLDRRRDRMRAYFDSLAGRFGREYLPGRSWQGLAEALLALLPPLVIADFGAGEGTFSQLLASRAQRVIAIDNSEKMVQFGAELASRHGLANLEFRQGDMEAAPIGNQEVDLVFFSQSLHHASHPEKAIGEAWRICKPGGRVAILDLLRHPFEQARELYADLWLGFTEVELRRFLENRGFESVQAKVVHREAEPPYFETVLAVGTKP
jgi:ubiquinone/menaquinone biosynthesis C-methylase UbiE